MRVKILHSKKNNISIYPSKNCWLWDIIIYLQKSDFDTTLMVSEELVCSLIYKHSFCLSACLIGWTYYMENCYYLNQTGTAWESARLGDVLLITSPIICDVHVKSLMCRAHIHALLCNLICIFVHNFFCLQILSHIPFILYNYVDHAMHITLKHF